VAPQRCRLATVEVVWHCIGIYQSDEHSQHDCRSLHHTFTAPCWQVSCLRSRIFANSQVMFGHQVAPQRCRLATVEVVWHCIGIYQSDEHSQHDCRSLHHTFTAPCWQVSRLRSRIFANSQVMFGHQVAPQRCRLATVEVVWHCIGIYQSDEHSQHDCRSLHHTFTAPCWQVSRLRSRIFANSQVTFGHQVAPQRCRLATVEVVWHCIGVYQSDEHSQHDCKSLHHTFTAPCWLLADFMPQI